VRELGRKNKTKTNTFCSSCPFDVLVNYLHAAVAQRDAVISSLPLSLYFQWVHNSQYILATVDPLLSPYSMMMTIIIIIITVFGVTDRVGGESSFPPLTVSPCATGRQEPEHGCRRGSEIKQVGLPVAALPLPLTVSPPCVRREAGSVACVQEEGRPVPAASL